jgi:hypothetical protein
VPRFIWVLAQSSGTRARIFLQGFAMGGDGFFQPRRPALPLAEPCERVAQQNEGGSTLVGIARRGRHAPRHLNCDFKREIDPLLLAFRVECVPPLPVFLRPSRISVRCIHGRDGLDPPCHGDRITAKQILFDARFVQSLPRSLGSGAVLLLPPVEFGEGVVHSLGAAVVIAGLGRLGEALQYLLDKGLLIRPALAFGDDAEGNTDRIL